MKIFISYRRADTATITGRVYERLVAAFGSENIFRDIDSIAAGKDFRKVLDEATNGCNIMLVMVGPLWAGVTDSAGNKRLFDPNDFTRIEVENGLQHSETLVIPVLAMGATMPSPNDLPESLRELTFRNAVSVRNDPDFNVDIQRVIRSLKHTEGTEEGGIALTKFVLYKEANLSSPIVLNAREGMRVTVIGQDSSDAWLQVQLSGGEKGWTLAQDLRLNYAEPEREILPGESYEPVMVKIPAGSFLMGSDELDSETYEKPQHEVMLPSYLIGKFPITNSQYEAFILDTGRLASRLMGWDGQKAPEDSGEIPVRGVTWQDALAYCQWLGNKTGRKYVLPNEAQWEKACKGNYGCSDPTGNVPQWTSSLWGEKLIAPDPKYFYPWKDDGRNNLNANSQIRRVVRGMAGKDQSTLHKFTARSGQAPDNSGPQSAPYGFRVVMIPQD